MRTGKYIILVYVFLAGLLSSGSKMARDPNLIICCEQRQNSFMMFRENRNWNRDIEWYWDYGFGENILPTHLQWFANPSEAKYVLNGSHLLGCFSSGAVVLIRIADKDLVFYAYQGVGSNPHSVEILPDGNIVCSSSWDSKLSVYSRHENIVFFDGGMLNRSDIHMNSAHGVIWDKKREILWAIGMDSLVSFEYNFDKRDPALIRSKGYLLPDRGGHDLSAVPGKDALYLTTENGIWVFDIPGADFDRFEPGPRMKNVKSISQAVEGGEIILIKATERWYSNTIQVAGKRKHYSRKGARFYKARWWAENAFSYE